MVIRKGAPGVTVILQGNEVFAENVSIQHNGSGKIFLHPLEEPFLISIRLGLEVGRFS